MKILFLGDIRPSHLKRWRDYFKERGHDVMAISLEEDHTDDDYMHIKSRMPITPFKYYLEKEAIREIISEFKPDIVNGHFAPSYGLLAVATGFHPTVVSLWGSDILVSPHRSKLHLARAMWVLRNCDLITSDSDYMTDETGKLGKFDTKIVTEPMGVPRLLFEQFGNSARKFQSEETVIISTRRLEPLYRVDLLIKALGMVQSELSPFKCIICGDGSQRAKLELLSEAYNLGQVSFVGWESGDEYFNTLHDADIYVSCSESDSTSVSLLEAMAAGAFPVVTDIPGNTEWIRNKESALTFPVGDTDTLAARLIQAVGNIKLRQSAAIINRRMIESRAIWENNMNRIERAFGELVDCKR